MKYRRTVFLLVCAMALATLAACGRSEPVSSASQAAESTTVTERAAANPIATASPAAASTTLSETAGTGPTAEAVAETEAGHHETQAVTWDNSTAVQIKLNGSSIAVDGRGVAVDGSKATITSAGTYVISGSLNDGQIIVDADDQAVRLVLNGVDIHCSTGAPIYVRDAEATVIVLADNTENHVADEASYVLEDGDEPNAAVFSKADLGIDGNGSLTVDANYNDGIASKDGLVIASGTINVTSVDDGIRGKDYIVVSGGNITVQAQGDGLKSDNEEDATQGYISIKTGVIKITCGGDAVQAETAVTITDGEFTLSSGGGSNSRISANTSAKGIKAGVKLNIAGGTFTIDSADDAVHSNGSLVINGGTFTISSGDDAMHADLTLEVNGGDIRIIDCYEGIESAVITINDGDIHLAARDDGINVAAGRDGSGTNLTPGPGGRPGRGGGPGQDAFAYASNCYLYVNGGYVVIDAAGDGIDVNGSIQMTDGVVIVHGPTEQMNGALDCIGTFNITGGFLVAAGSAGMAESPDASSSQYSLLLNFNGTLQAGTLVHIQTRDGNEILTFSPTKRCQSIAFSSPELIRGTTYDVYYGGTPTGTAHDGLYQDGTYTPGTQYTSFTISGMVTRLGSGIRR